ncbi:MAG: family 2 glycosyl transferase [Thermoplasmata archaeon]|nr:family 2 glycosyl transferase [Thermoplasmata archaeon]
MISVVCVYNDRHILENSLLSSLSAQQGNHETVLIDNCKGEFKSAAAALNSGGKRAKGDFIAFVHQDITFGSKDSLARLESLIDQNPHVGIAGIAGMRDSKVVISNMTHGMPPVKVGRIRVYEPTEVQTLDECLIIIPARIYRTLQFDEVACDGWHLYSVDYCLSVRRLGLSVLVLPCEVHHLSSGEKSMTDDYYETLAKVMDKHRDSFPSIYTTMGNWHAGCPIVPQRVYNSFLRWFSKKTGTVTARARRIAEKLKH